MSIRVFIGFDPRETVAFHALCHSIHAHASEPVSITPLSLAQLKRLWGRPRDPLQSTDFSFSRFLTPWLVGYEGWALFTDCDMLFRDDIAKLWALQNEQYAVAVVKHNHVPKEDVKFLGTTQTKYAKKNWSSVMLFNAARCRQLTPEYVRTASGLDLHQFRWLEGESLVGELPHRWNHLVDVDPYDPTAGAVHFTLGGPFFHEYQECAYSADWFAARDAMLRCVQRGDARGRT